MSTPRLHTHTSNVSRKAKLFDKQWFSYFSATFCNPSALMQATESSSLMPVCCWHHFPTHRTLFNVGLFSSAPCRSSFEGFGWMGVMSEDVLVVFCSWLPFCSRGRGFKHFLPPALGKRVTGLVLLEEKNALMRVCCQGRRCMENSLRI